MKAAMEDSLKTELEDLIARYKHNVHLNETLIKTKLDVINSNDLYINPISSHGDILEFLECRVKMQSFHAVIGDLEDILRKGK